MADKSVGTTQAPLLFTNRAEIILTSFFKVFFSQDRLFNTIQNQFKYTDGVAKDSLVIGSSDDRAIETVNAFPALVIVPGPWELVEGPIDHRNEHAFGSRNDKIMFVLTSFSVHAICANNGTAEVLQGLATAALVMFRRALYEEGLDYISNPNGSPPRKVSQPNDDQKFAAPFFFSVRHRLDWIESVIAPAEQKISVSIHAKVQPGQAGTTREVVAEPAE